MYQRAERKKVFILERWGVKKCRRWVGLFQQEIEAVGGSTQDPLGFDRRRGPEFDVLTQ